VIFSRNSVLQKALEMLVFDDDHVDGVRRLLTAATNGHIVHPQGDMWLWRTTVE
jgi:hypothetical protein